MSCSFRKSCKFLEKVVYFLEKLYVSVRSRLKVYIFAKISSELHIFDQVLPFFMRCVIIIICGVVSQ